MKSTDNVIHIEENCNPFMKGQFHCAITNHLDEYQGFDYDNDHLEFKNVMRTYMMTPDVYDNKTLIPLRVPGATRGHIEVIPHNGFWKVIEVELYDSSTIIGISNIGCYKPEVKSILDEFKGILIDFKQYNPKEEK